VNLSGLIAQCAVAAALAVYRRGERRAPGADPRRDLAALDRALAEVQAEEATAVQAQIVGIVRGVSADATAAAFAGIVARRQDLEERRAALAATLSRAGDRKAGGASPRRRL